MASSPSSLEALVKDAAERIRSTTATPTRLGIILGSGLGHLVGQLKDAQRTPAASLAGYPRSTVEGHAGGFVSGLLADVPVLCAEGRIHGYEGHSDAFLGLPARVLIAAGCDTLIITNAAGGIHPEFRVGDLMVITDHLNMTGRSPLTGPNVETWGPRFPDISRVYDERLLEHILRTANQLGQELRTGVYACMPGPQYETPAEVRMLRILGADAVGMSTVPEAIIAAHAGIHVLAISVICNLAAGISATPLSHAEVMEQGQLAGLRLSQLLVAMLPTLPMRT